MILLPPEYLTTPNQSTPEEPTHQTYQIPDRSDTQNNTPPDWQSIQLLLQMQQQMQLQLLEMQIQMRQLERKSCDRPSISFPRSQSTNSYSPIMQLGFTLITFLFLSIAVFMIGYIFVYTFSMPGAEALFKAGSLVLTPLVVLVFCIVAMVIILEPFHR